MTFTGDALLICGCWRTDFQQGGARRLSRCVRNRILTLPDATRLYSGHDYRDATVTTVEGEKRLSSRLGMARSEDEFAAIMQALKLGYPMR